jgi:hypothetical protein
MKLMSAVRAVSCGVIGVVGATYCWMAMAQPAPGEPPPPEPTTTDAGVDPDAMAAELDAAPPAPPTPEPEKKPEVPFDTGAPWGVKSANAALAPPYELGAKPASDERTSSVAILINPAGFFFNVLTFDVAYAMSDKLALVGLGTIFTGEFSGGGAGIGIQYFPSPRRTFHGFYLLPSIRYWSLSTDITVSEVDENGDLRDVEKSADASLIAVGTGIGYQFNWGFALRLGGGAYYAIATAESSGYEADFRGFVPTLEVALGGAF